VAWGGMPSRPWLGCGFPVRDGEPRRHRTRPHFYSHGHFPMARLILCGNKEILRKGFDHLIKENRHRVLAVVTNRECTDADTLHVLREASRYSIYTSTANINSLADVLRPLEADALLSFQYRSLVKRAVLDLTPVGCLNLHFGLLPDYGGCSVVAWAILNRERHAGVTFHKMDSTFDTGDIYTNRAIELTADTDAKALFAALTGKAAEVIEQDLNPILEGKLTPRPQPPGRYYYKKDSLDFSVDKYINWRMTGPEVLAQYNAFRFPPLQYPSSRHAGDTLSFTGRATLSRLEAVTLPPGKVAVVAGKTFVGTGSDDLLEIEEIEHECANRFVEKAVIDTLEASDFWIAERLASCRIG
jgi:methionyl-tRNA formyltransferase